MPIPTTEAVEAALVQVIDPEIRRPITELGMVKSVDVAPDGAVTVGIYLTVAACPLRDRLGADVRSVVGSLDGVSSVAVELDVMSDEQRAELRARLRGPGAERVIPFSEPTNLTKVYAVASGKGGVGKSSVTANLGVALAQAGLQVGIIDADIYGHSIPRMLGSSTAPTMVEHMIMPPQAHGLRLMSIGMFVEDNSPIVWRGPMLHRALEQFLADVFWGDLDVLLLDLPPGTGDMAISVAQLLPAAELIIVTTPQLAAREVAERAGAISAQTHQRITGVIENMAGLTCPCCGEHIDVFGAGGGEAVAAALSAELGTKVPLLGSVPIDVNLRAGADAGEPVVVRDPDSAAARELHRIAAGLATIKRGLVGKPLPFTVS